MEDKITEKVYCYDHPSAYKTDNSPMWAALMANKDNGNEALMYNQMNNPMWLVWMMAMRWMYGNGEYGNNAQLSQMQTQISDNQNFNSVLNSLMQNQSTLQNIADRTNTNIDFVRQSLCTLNSAVQNVAGKTELSAERVINAINLGDANITSQMLQCCCQNKMLVQEMGYKNELANERQTNTLSAIMASNHSADTLQDCQYHGQTMSRIDQLANGIQQGFAQVGYQMQTDKCDILQNNNFNTQRIVDTLNSHWNQELQQKYADARLELSQQAQNAYLISQLKTTA